MIFPDDNYQIIKERFIKERILVILRGSYNDVRNVGMSLLKAGLGIIEIATNTGNYSRLIKELQDYNQLLSKQQDARIQSLIGVGTILNNEHMRISVEAGADFFISPCVIEIDKSFEDKVYIPGIFSPMDVFNAYKNGYKIQKIFPASQFNYNYIKNLNGPYPDIDFIVSGGIKRDDVKPWIDNGALAVNYGSILMSKYKDCDTDGFNRVVEDILKFREEL